VLGENTSCAVIVDGIEGRKSVCYYE